MKLKKWCKLIIALLVLAVLAGSAAIYTVQRKVTYAEKKFVYSSWDNGGLD